MFKYTTFWHVCCGLEQLGRIKKKRELTYKALKKNGRFAGGVPAYAGNARLRAQKSAWMDAMAMSVSAPTPKKLSISSAVSICM